MSYFFLVIFSLLPSIIWLLFYLRKDIHPESKQMILKIFFWGMVVAIAALFVELRFFQISAKLPLAPHLISILNIFIGVSLTEEVLKYLVIREKVLSNSEFDEPIDVIIYMIIAALGFAASENILILFKLGPPFLVSELLTITSLRFLGATFLHALASGGFGFFLALSFFEIKRKRQIFSLGLLISTLLHGLFNFSILEEKGILQVLVPSVILVGLAIFLSFGIWRLKKLKSICKTN